MVVVLSFYCTMLC